MTTPKHPNKNPQTKTDPPNSPSNKNCHELALARTCARSAPLRAWPPRGLGHRARTPSPSSGLCVANPPRDLTTYRCLCLAAATAHRVAACWSRPRPRLTVRGNGLVAPHLPVASLRVGRARHPPLLAPHRTGGHGALPRALPPSRRRRLPVAAGSEAGPLRWRVAVRYVPLMARGPAAVALRRWLQLRRVRPLRGRAPRFAAARARHRLTERGEGDGP